MKVQQSRQHSLSWGEAHALCSPSIPGWGKPGISETEGGCAMEPTGEQELSCLSEDKWCLSQKRGILTERKSWIRITSLFVFLNRVDLTSRVCSQAKTLWFTTKCLGIVQCFARRFSSSCLFVQQDFQFMINSSFFFPHKHKRAKVYYPDVSHCFLLSIWRNRNP